MVAFFCLLCAVIAAQCSVASPANDWNKPCFHGECAYEIHPSTGSSGVVKLRGSERSITDITPAAGWVILDCDPHTLVQDIRLVCKSDEAEADCNHVFAHHGPVNKIVRLPEFCGHGPFARIARARIAEDQLLPAHVEGSITRRDGISPVVHVLSIDLNYDVVDVSQIGEVLFAFQGINAPGYDANFEFTDAWWDDAWGWLKGAANTVAKTATSAGQAVAKTATDAWQTVKNLPKIIHDKTHFDISTEAVPKKRLEFRGNKNVLNIQKQGCSVNGHLTVDISGDGFIEVSLGVVAEGHLVPPSIDKFGAFADISADVNGKVNIDAAIAGGVKSEKKSLFSAGIPGLSIPGVFTIGPFLDIQAQGRAYLELQLQAELNLNYHVEHMQIWFPKSAGQPTHKDITTKDSPLTIEASANLEARGLVIGHVSPALKVGVKVGANAAEASFFVEADAFVRLNLHAQANAQFSHHRRMLDESTTRSSAHMSYVPPYDSSLRDLALRSPSDVAFSGCVWVDYGIEIRLGMTGKIFNTWASDAAFPLWISPTPLLYQQCWALGKESPAVGAPTQAEIVELDKKVEARNQQCAKGDKPRSVIKRINMKIKKLM